MRQLEPSNVFNKIFDYVGHEFSFAVLIFILFVVPKFFQRYRIPSAITSFVLGFIAGGFGDLAKDPTIKLLATLGIVSLFLFAGLEINLRELRQGGKFILQHLAIRAILLLVATLVISKWSTIVIRPSLLVALALFTPSTGFILDSLGSLAVTMEDRLWIKTKAIAGELLALLALFFTLQSTTFFQFLLSTSAFVLMILLIPVLFRFFAAKIVPHAPKSEFGFLLMLATICAVITSKLGAYYLVGAFVVGLAARRFQEKMPEVASEKILNAVEVFSSFFVPFYFFYSGSHLKLGSSGFLSLLMGLVFAVTALPVRLGLGIVHRKLALKEDTRASVRVGVSLLPTFVFTLVIVDILRNHYGTEEHILAGLVLYALLNTLIPGIVLKSPAAVYDAPTFGRAEREENK